MQLAIRLLIGLCALGLCALGMVAPVRAETCAEIAARCDKLRLELSQMEQDAGSGDARLLECQAAVAAAFAERREMKQAGEPNAWAAASYRALVELNVLVAVIGGARITRARGDPMRPVEEVVATALKDGVLSLDEADAPARLLALAHAPHTVSQRLGTAAVDALKAHLDLLAGVQVASLLTDAPLPAPVPDKTVPVYDAPDRLITESPALAGRAADLKARSSALDLALVALAHAAEREKRPAETQKDDLDKKRAALAKAQSELANCK